jgi:hypothetical protein
MGSKGHCFRQALARVLVQHYLKLNPVSSTLELELSDSDLKAKLGPEVSTPCQEDSFSCSDYVLHTCRRILVDVVQPSLLHQHGSGAAGGAGELPLICIESIMTRNWFNRDDALKERDYLKEFIMKLQQSHQQESHAEGSVSDHVPGSQPLQISGCINNSHQVPESEWELYCDEIATKRDQVERERKLTTNVMQLMSGFQGHARNYNEHTCKSTTQQVSVFLLSALHLEGLGITVQVCSQVMQHLLECNFQFPARGTGDRKLVNEIVAGFVHRLEGLPELDWQPESAIEIHSATPCDSELSDSVSGASDEKSKESNFADEPPKKRRKTAAMKKREAEAKKAEQLKDFQSKEVEGQRWKGYIYIHPSCRSLWVKMGTSAGATRRAAGQNSTTFGPELVARKVEVDLGDKSTTSKTQSKKHLKNAENLCRLILRRHHQHRKREVM